MANAVKWSAPVTTADLLTTELNALASATLSAASAEQDNATNKDRWADFVLNVTYGTNPAAGGHVALYMTVALDGSNHSDVQRDMTSMLVGAFPLRATTVAQRVPLSGIRLPPYKVKFFVDNQAGQAMSASGHTVKWGRYNEEIQ
jgi:hypothetical protein